MAVSIAMGQPLPFHAALEMCGRHSFTAGSLQFEFAEAEEQRASDRSEVSHARLASLEDRLGFLCQAAGPFCARLQRDFRRLMRIFDTDGGVDVVVMASRLSLMGYQVTVRTAIGGGPSCFKNLRHEFLTVAGEDQYKEAEYVVDPFFREQFRIPQPTATYTAVLSMVPEEFVGTASRLIPLVQCLCSEMVTSFEARGLTLPPWRRAQAMMSKWLPSKCKDIPFSTGGSSGGISGTASSNTCFSDGEGCSPTAIDASSQHSPFCRISDFQVADRCSKQSSSKSLLAGKFATAGSSNISLSRGFSRSSCNSSVSSVSSNLRRQAGPTVAGMVSMQPSLYHGQPPTYKVKMAACVPQA